MCPILAGLSLCRDPVGCCAVFVALMTAIQQCNHEYAVNVLQVVKGIRMQKPGAVCSAVRIHWCDGVH